MCVQGSVEFDAITNTSLKSKTYIYEDVLWSMLCTGNEES